MDRSSPILSTESLAKQVVANSVQLDLLSDINLTIYPGESVAIVGQSGAGKTTLLSLLAGLDLPSAGSVYLAGRPFSTEDENGRARLRGEYLGFVFQSFQLLPSLTALENVMLPLELMNRDAKEPAKAILQRVDLAERFDHYPQQLSGGEQQRVAIARAFVSHPKLLLADEPTGNLDSVTGQRIIDLLFELNLEQGTTLVLVTHDQELAARCERRLTLAAGRLVSEL